MAKKAHIYIYGAIAQPDPMAEMFGVTEQSISAKDISVQLANIKEKEIDVHIKSNGGSVSEGYAIHDLLVNSGKKITTIGEGEVRSIATVVFLAGTERLISQHCDFTIHNPWLDPSTLGKMESSDLIKVGNDMKAEEEKLANFYAKSLNKDVEEIKTKMAQETTLSSQEALDMGFATAILSPSKAAVTYSDKIFAYINKPKQNQKEMNKKIDSLFGKIKALINGNVKADMTTLEDGVIVYHDGEPAEGTPVFEDEAMTVPAKDGDYKTKDGLLISIADGKITKVVDNAPIEDEVLKLKAELAAKEAALAAKENEINVLKNPAPVAETEAEKILAKELAEKKAQAEKAIKEVEVAKAEIETLKANEEKVVAQLAEVMAEVKNLKAGIKAPKAGAQNFIKDKTTGKAIPVADTSKLNDRAKAILHFSR